MTEHERESIEPQPEPECSLEEELVAAALAGIADSEAGRYTTISSRADADAFHERVMARLRARLQAEGRLVEKKRD